MSIRRVLDEYRVTFMEMTAKRAEECAYYTDCLDDAVHTAALMRTTEQRK